MLADPMIKKWIRFSALIINALSLVQSMFRSVLRTPEGFNKTLHNTVNTHKKANYTAFPERPFTSTPDIQYTYDDFNRPTAAD